jgi:putative hydrolase of the HAD superfamily
MGGTLLEYGGAGRWPAAMRLAYESVEKTLIDAGFAVKPDVMRDVMVATELELCSAATTGQASPTIVSCLAEGIRRLGLPASNGLVDAVVSAYRDAMRPTCEPFPDGPAVLAELKARGLRIGLISNTFFPGEYHEYDLDRFGLLSHFDHRIFSADIGLWKPRPEIFQRALTALDLRADEAVFVGDRLVDDVGGARGAGLRGVLIEYLPGDRRDFDRGAAMGIVPDARIASIGELPGIIESLGR